MKAGGVDTSNWIGGAHVLVPTETIREFDWADGRLNVNLTTNRIRSAPRYDPGTAIDRTVEEALDAYYNLRTRNVQHRREEPAGRVDRGASTGATTALIAAAARRFNIGAVARVSTVSPRR